MPGLVPSSRFGKPGRKGLKPARGCGGGGVANSCNEFWDLWSASPRTQLVLFNFQGFSGHCLSPPTGPFILTPGSLSPICVTYDYYFSYSGTTGATCASGTFPQEVITGFFGGVGCSFDGPYLGMHLYWGGLPCYLAMSQAWSFPFTIPPGGTLSGTGGWSCDFTWT